MRQVYVGELFLDRRRKRLSLRAYCMAKVALGLTHLRLLWIMGSCVDIIAQASLQVRPALPTCPRPRRLGVAWKGERARRR